MIASCSAIAVGVDRHRARPLRRDRDRDERRRRVPRRVRRRAARRADDRRATTSSGDCSRAAVGGAAAARPASKSPSTNVPSIVNSATFGPDVPRSIVRTCSVNASLHVAPLQAVAEEAADRPRVRVVVVGDVAHVVVDVVLELEVLATRRRRAARACARAPSAGGSTPWPRHTTIGTAQISHSAIQQMSSSWNQGVIRAASHRSQPSACS